MFLFDIVLIDQVNVGFVEFFQLVLYLSEGGLQICHASVILFIEIMKKMIN